MTNYTIKNLLVIIGHYVRIFQNLQGVYVQKQISRDVSFLGLIFFCRRERALRHRRIVRPYVVSRNRFRVSLCSVCPAVSQTVSSVCLGHKNTLQHTESINWRLNTYIYLKHFKNCPDASVLARQPAATRSFFCLRFVRFSE